MLGNYFVKWLNFDKWLHFKIVFIISAPVGMISLRVVVLNQIFMGSNDNDLNVTPGQVGREKWALESDLHAGLISTRLICNY